MASLKGTLRRELALFGVLLALIGVANWWASDHDAQLDLSAEHRFSLSSDSRRLISAVHAPLQVTVFLNTTGSDAADARFLLARYHELNHRITYRVVDPDEDPVLARKYGITDYDTVVLQYEGRRVDAPDAEELDLSTALLEVLQGKPDTICVLTGHGEDDLSDTTPSGFSEVAALLKTNDYVATTLDLTTGAQRSVPPDCAVVMIDGPRDALLPPEIAAINAYTAAGGALLVMATPLSSADPNPILNQWGIHFIGGLVVDPSRAVGTDLSNLVVEDLPSLSPVDSQVTRLEMPAPGALAATSDEAAGLDVQQLAVTSAGSYVAPDPNADVGYEKGDLSGPIVVAAGADASKVLSSGSGAQIQRTRVLATGTDLWATNEFIDDLGDRRFLVNGLAWLSQRNQLIVATNRPDQPAGLPLTPARQTRVVEITIILIPLGLFGLGCARALIRRRRRVPQA